MILQLLLALLASSASSLHLAPSLHLSWDNDIKSLN